MKNYFAILMLVLSSSLFAQTTPQGLIDNFFAVYKVNPGKAVRDIYATNKWTDRAKDDIEKVVGTVEGFNENYMGKYYGFELITTKKFTDCFELHSYVVKYDRQPIRFIFKFYKPNDKWMLFAFELDDNIDNELQEAAKINNLDLEKK